MTRQLPLGVRLQDAATFENFLPADNERVLDALHTADTPSLYLWGAAGTGKSHLLQAVCHQAAVRNQRAAYLPLADPGLEPAMLDGMEQFERLCLDDLEAVAGDPAWETALFHVYNRLIAAGHQLLVTATGSPTALGIQLPDLRSRLGWGPVFQLQPLGDAAKRQALQQRASARGLSLDDEVTAYLMSRCPRDMRSLFALLDGLDEASLVAQRRLTIPFVREYLAHQSVS
ncbi:DnaA regulatory inactivator Hda [Thiohalophilus sp.]|uniref:DnaA regulatory inactivator Hda n=1 Tax=Thiohalophilus sp. TaxID=3028392 RepID=UPI003975B8F6